MTQTWPNIPSTDAVRNSRTDILARDETLKSNFSGTAFPTTDLVVGMYSYRTDTKKLYILESTGPSVWRQIMQGNAVEITGGSIVGITDLAVADGGTGASTAADARTNLGLGSLATQAADAVAITGGSVIGLTSLTTTQGSVMTQKLNQIYAADSGTANAIIVAPSPAFTAYATPMMVMVKVLNTNTGAVTINVNGLGVKAVKKNGNTSLTAGDIVAGQIVELFYDGSNFQMLTPTAVTLALVPVGSSIFHNGLTVPSGFLAEDGRAVSRTTYADLFAAIGTLHGSGDGSTTFNLPDSRGRAKIGLDNMSSVGSSEGAANRVTGSWADTVGGTGGSETDGGSVGSHTLTIDEIPAHSHSSIIAQSSGGQFLAYFSGSTTILGNGTTGSAGGGLGHSHTFTATTGGNVQPSMAGVWCIKT